MLTIEPHSGVGGLMPRPMKLRLAMARMDPAMDSVACTMMGAMQLGRMCLRMMRLSLAPMARAASMYSSFLMVRTAERTIRAKGGMLEMLMASIIFVTLVPMADTRAMDSRMLGIARKMSMTRMMTSSTRRLP